MSANRPTPGMQESAARAAPPSDPPGLAEDVRAVGRLAGAAVALARAEAALSATAIRRSIAHGLLAGMLAAATAVFLMVAFAIALAEWTGRWSVGFGLAGLTLGALAALVWWRRGVWQRSVGFAHTRGLLRDLVAQATGPVDSATDPPATASAGAEPRH